MTFTTVIRPTPFQYHPSISQLFEVPPRYSCLKLKRLIFQYMLVASYGF